MKMLPIVMVLVVLGGLVYFWLLKRATEKESRQFAALLAEFVEARLLANGELFVEDLKHESLAQQYALSEERKRDLWERTVRILEKNPRLSFGQKVREGELCTVWRLA